MEQRFSFKKLMSIVVVIAMLCSTFMFVVPASAESTNILAGKEYELSGCGVRSTYTANLTDGLATSDMTDSGTNWFGFYNNGTNMDIINAPDGVGYAIVDLGQEYNIDKVRTNVICKTSWGIPAPAAVNVYFSADGEDWGEANAFTFELVEGEGKWLELTGEWTANFIKFEYVLDGTFVFTNEIEAYGVAVPADDDTSDDTSSDDTSSDDTSSEEPTDPVEPELENILLGYAFENTCGRYSYKDVAATDGTELTDGYYVTDENVNAAIYKDDNWGAYSGVNGNVLELTTALDGAYDISKFGFYVANGLCGSGICEPGTITVFLKNGEGEWVQFGETFESTETDDTQGNNTSIISYIEITSDTAVTATDVKVAITTRTGKALIFISEIEAYGVAATADEEESSDVVEESSDVVEESSDVVEESSDVVEESSDVVEDSSDVVEESSDVVDEPTVEPENIAFNKEYSTHDPRGGYNANLTDGVKNTAMAYSGDHWFAFMSNPTSGVGNLDGSRTASVIINLEGSYDIASVVINAIQNTGSGIPLPKSVQVFLSDDGATWGDAIDLDIPTDTSVNTAFEIAGDVVGTASFVKVEVTLGDGGTFAFINEIEVYGVAAEADDDESSDVVEDSSDVVEDSSDVVEDSSDVVEDSSDVVEDSSDVVEDSSDVVEDSSDVVEDSSDDTSDDSSDDTSDNSSDDTSDDSSDDTSDDSSDDTSDDPQPDPDPDPTIAYGDVNGDGEVNVIDYALVKRAAFGTYDLSEDEYVRANVYADDVIDSTDYLLVKRIAFGTYDPYAEPTPAEPAPAE